MINYKDLIKSPDFKKYINKMQKVSHHYEPFSYINKYHLEGDIWSHTMMVIDYIQNSLKSSNNDLYLTALFHDTGKTYNYQINEKKKKIQFTNHWFYSGNIFRNSFLQKIDRTQDIPYLFNLYRVIQLHQINQFPQEIKDNLNIDLSYKNFKLLKNLCDADEKGRILDDEIKEAGYDKYFIKYSHLSENNFNNSGEGFYFIKFEDTILEIEKLIENSIFEKIVILPIAPPASGKSTIAFKLEEIYREEFYRIGYDDIRLEIFCEKEYKDKFRYNIKTSTTEIYQEAYQYTNKNKIDIHSILMKRINDKLNENGRTIIFIDNTNVSFKSRRKILNSLYKKESILKIGIFLFNLTLEEIFKRNEKRNIKIKKSVIENIYNTTAFPSLTEFNKILII
jgi:predicted kinase